MDSATVRYTEADEPAVANSSSLTRVSDMKRHRMLNHACSHACSGFSAVLMAIVVHGTNPQPVAASPNVILVLPDDVGYGDYACLGNPVMRASSVYAFKQQSLLLTQFYVSPTCTDI